MNDPSEALRYPIGRFHRPEHPTSGARRQWVRDLRHLPMTLREAVHGLDVEQLDTPYRTGGWTIRQVAHHVADSHLNGYIRTKWTLTETSTRIKTYDQDAWSALPDSSSLDPAVSLDLLHALHTRWVRLLEDLSSDDWQKRFEHPDAGAQCLDELIALYAWHGRHHTAHILGLRSRNRW